MAMSWATSGCGGDGGGAGGDVNLTVSQAVAMKPSFDAFNSSNGNVIVDSEGVVHFTSS